MTGLTENKGELITTERGISIVGARVVLKSEEERHWKSVVLISHSDIGNLPQIIDEGESPQGFIGYMLKCWPGGAQRLREVESNFTDVPLDKFEEKNKQWYKSKKHHFVTEHSIHVKLGSADLSFELVHNGHVMSTKKPIDFQWCEVATVHGPE